MKQSGRKRRSQFILFCWGVSLFASAAISPALADNLANCYDPSESKPCTPMSTPALYPKPVKKVGSSTQATAVSGCYSMDMKLVRELADPINSRCETGDAPIRFYLTYRTLCPGSLSVCYYGSQVMIIPNLTVDGPNPFGEGFNPDVSSGLPFKISKGQVGVNAREACEILKKQDSSYEYDPVTQSCTKPMRAVCEDIGFYWSAAYGKCISQKQLLCSSCTDAAKYCSGHTYVPTGAANCFCMGTSTTLERDNQGPCHWVHWEQVTNPVCDRAFQHDPNYKWVAYPDPTQDRCCLNGNCCDPEKSADQNRRMDENCSLPPRVSIQPGGPAPQGIPWSAGSGTCEAAGAVNCAVGGTGSSTTTGTGTSTGTGSSEAPCSAIFCHLFRQYSCSRKADGTFTTPVLTSQSCVDEDGGMNPCQFAGCIKGSGTGGATPTPTVSVTPPSCVPADASFCSTFNDSVGYSPALACCEPQGAGAVETFDPDGTGKCECIKTSGVSLTKCDRDSVGPACSDTYCSPKACPQPPPVRPVPTTKPKALVCQGNETWYESLSGCVRSVTTDCHKTSYQGKPGVACDFKVWIRRSVNGAIQTSDDNVFNNYWVGECSGGSMPTSMSLLVEGIMIGVPANIPPGLCN